MTKRTAHQHRMLELKSKAMSKIANKMFTFKKTGIDGLVKKMFLPGRKPDQSMEDQMVST